MRFLLCIGIILSVSICIYANPIVIELNYEDFDPKIIQSTDGFSIWLKDGFEPLPGQPYIEHALLGILLPSGYKASSIKILEKKIELLSLKRPLIATEVPVPDGSGRIDTFEVNYPQHDVIELASSGCAMGYNVAFVNYYPAIFNLNEGLIIHKYVKFEIEIVKGQSCRKPKKLSPFAEHIREKTIGGYFTYGISMLDYPKSKIIPMFELIGSDDFNIPPRSDDKLTDVLVITSDSLIGTVRDYLNETRHGFSQRYVAIEDVLSAYEGSDDAEGLRNFIIDAYENWGIWALFLVGDYEIIPIRYLKERGASLLWYDCLSDLYYASLDGTINSNGDNIFGELSADDLYPEIYYSRLQVKNSTEIIAFSNKQQKYIYNHPVEFFNKSLFVGGSIENRDDNFGADYKNYILSVLRLDTLLDVVKLYSNKSITGGDYEISPENFIALLDSGFATINHFEHGNQTFISFGSLTGKGGLHIRDIVDMDNEYYPVMYSFSCELNGFNTDNISQRWVNNPSGGGVAMFAHSSIAWTYQRVIDMMFWKSFVQDSSTTTGEILNKWQYRMGDHYYKKAIVGLVGSPLTPVSPFKAVDETLILLNSEIRSSNDTLIAVITPPLIHRTLLTISSNRRVIERTWITGDSVTISLPYIFEDSIIVTLHSLPRKSEKLPVVPVDYGVMRVLDFEVNEVSGDSDDLVEIGEFAQVLWKIVNLSTTTAMDSVFMSVDGFPESEDKEHIVLDALDTVKIKSNIFEVDSFFSGNLETKAIIKFKSGSSDTFDFNLYAPSFELIAGHWSDEDNIPSLGDSGILTIRLGNRGFADAKEVIVRLSGPGYSFLEDSIVINIAPRGVSDITTHVILPRFYMFPFTIHLSYMDSDFVYNYIIYSFETVKGLKLTSNTDYIRLDWEPIAAVKGYFVLRGEDTLGFEYLNDFPIHNSFYVDRNIENKKYNYRVIAVDSNGICGPPSIIVTGELSFQLAEGFPVDLPVGAWVLSAPMTVDIDGDSLKEIYVADAEGNLVAYRYNGEELVDSTCGVDPILSVDVRLRNGFWAPPAAADIDNDGEIEIIVAIRDFPGSLWALDPYGVPKPGFPVSLGAGILASFVLEDLNDDNTLEIILLDQNRRLHIVNCYGMPYIGSTYLVDSTFMSQKGIGSSAPAVGDIDGDGLPEIVVGGGIDTLGNGYIYAWNHDGSRVHGFPYKINGTPSNPADPLGSVVMGNLDDDTTDLEIVILVKGKGIFAIDGDGTTLDGFPCIERGCFGDGIRSPSLFDIDRDKKQEIFIQSEDNLWVITYDGLEYPGFPIPIGNAHWAGPIIGNLDDNVEDVEVLLTNDKILWGYNMDGSKVAQGFPLTTEVAIVAYPTIDDIDNDGLAEIIAAAYDGKLYVWDTDAEYEENQFMWLHSRHDIRRTGVVNTYRGLKISQRNTPKPDEISISISPNPFNSSCFISGYSPDKGIIEVIDFMGRIVDVIGEVNGSYAITWFGKDIYGSCLNSGLYFVRLSGKDFTVSKKLFIIR